jgi:parallel beta-helix repeat protein
MKFLLPTGISLNTLKIRWHVNADCARAFAFVVLIVGICHSATASALYVNPPAASNAFPTFTTIAAAVINADAGDTIYVAPGVYYEDVIIGKQLSLVGAGSGRSIINALNKPNGIYIDGLDNPGLNRAVVTGFTIKNANFEGILVTNASLVTIFQNEVIDNDKALIPPETCPGQPAFETAEGFDCGEGIHFSGVDHSTVADNIVKNNSGGILLSDDTGATHDNLIRGNVVKNNPFDCGITLASHPSASPTGGQPGVPLGVYHNTIAENESSDNGLAVEGAGAGVGIFDSVPGAQAFGNVVINNRLKDNGLPGVAMHSHTPGQNLNDNVIVGNHISGNHADTEDAATPGPTGINVFSVSPVTGTIISGNVIDDEAEDIVTNITNTPAQVAAHINDLLGGQIGVDNLGSGTVDATENWWGSPAGPGKQGATTAKGSVSFTPWLTHPIEQDHEKGNQQDDRHNNAER